MKSGYQCETCKSFHEVKTYIWDCFGCKKEVCENCFSMYGRCKSCASRYTEEELAHIWGEETGDLV